MLLVFANKQDLPNALSPAEVTEALGLQNLRNKKVNSHLPKCCSLHRLFLTEGVATNTLLTLILSWFFLIKSCWIEMKNIIWNKKYPSRELDFTAFFFCFFCDHSKNLWGLHFHNVYEGREFQKSYIFKLYNKKNYIPTQVLFLRPTKIMQVGKELSPLDKLSLSQNSNIKTYWLYLKD